MFGLFYDISLHLYALSKLPSILLHPKKYKKSFWKRLGRDFPLIEKKGKPLIWVHAVSLGETLAVAPLIKKLKTLENAPRILLSTVTETGHATGLKNIPEADYHVYLPFDFRYVIKPIVKRVAPELVILVETDYWYHFQEAAKKAGAHLIVVNGKISERSFLRLLRLPGLAKRLLAPFDRFCLQSKIYYERFKRLGVEPQKLTICGNLKLDAEIPFEKVDELKKKLGLEGKRILVLGSTHDPEEKIWIEALKQLWKDFADLKVILVPRHPERFETVAHLLTKEGIEFTRWSEQKTTDGPVLLVDTMGVLRRCYQLADLAFVGGSFTPKVGGHNILEPAFFGKPALFGPFMHGQPGFLDLITHYQAGLQLKPEEIVPTVTELFQHPERLSEIGERGRKMIEESKGALDKTFETVKLSLRQMEGA